MREENSALGGEQSGHFFCGEGYYGFDDAIVAGLRILAIVNTVQTPSLVPKHTKALEGGTHATHSRLSHLLEEFPKVYQAPERRPACADDKKVDVVRRVTEYFQTRFPVITLDGARIDFGSGAWAGIRYSNTSPCLSICLEARSSDKLRAIEEEVLAALRTEGVAIDEPQ